jgi:uncharacterized membrane protein YbhN (UPF0104 family)
MMKGTKLYQGLLSLLFLLALALLISRMNLDVVYLEIQDSDKLFISLGVLSLVVASILKIFRFSLVTRIYHHPIPLFEAALIQMVGISIATLTPGRVGEGSKAILLNKRSGSPMTSSVGIVIFERFFDMIFLATGAFFFSAYALQEKFTILIGLFVVALMVLFTIFLLFFNSFIKLIPERYIEYFTAVDLKGSPQLAFGVFALTAATWIFEAGLPWMLAFSMGVSVAFPLVFGVICISTIAVVLSILPAGLGTMDLSFLVLFPIIGVNSETALSILLIYRLFGIISPFLFSIILLNYKGTSFKEIRTDIEG